MVNCSGKNPSMFLAKKKQERVVERALFVKSKFQLQSIARAVEGGEDVFYFCGFESSPSRNSFLIKTDADGKVIFMKEYEAIQSLHFEKMKVSRNGDLLIAGDGVNRMEGFPADTRDGTLTRIAPDGTLLWSRFVFSGSTDGFVDLAEDPLTGDIYTVGNYFGTTLEGFAGMSGNQIAKWSAQGDLYKRVLIIPDIPTAPSHNRPSSCFWAHNSLFIAGGMALSNDRQSWMARVTPNLGALFFSTLDGPVGEGPADITLADHGYFMSFESGALDPWGGIPVSSGGHLLVTKVPWEGLLRLHELTGIKAKFFDVRMRSTYETPSVTEVSCYVKPTELAGGLESLLGQGAFLVQTSGGGSQADIDQELDQAQLSGNVYDLFPVVKDHVFNSLNLDELGIRNARDYSETSISSFADWAELLQPAR